MHASLSHRRTDGWVYGQADKQVKIEELQLPASKQRDRQQMQTHKYTDRAARLEWVSKLEHYDESQVCVTGLPSAMSDNGGTFFFPFFLGGWGRGEGAPDTKVDDT
jgi:hypothetical protein